MRSAVRRLLLLALLLPVAAAAAPDPLERLGLEPTDGAAPGYLDDAACAGCHAALAERYAEVGMARSFSDPAGAERIEDFGETFHHAASDRYYRIVEADDGLVFQRWQRAADGQEINRVELPVDWVLGSGNRARSYLHQTDWGELFMLPVGWYTETASWGMSPGFEAADHDGLGRRVQRQCLFCHNAYPEVPAGSDAHWADQRFPDDLPHGTGCQRCHGPGAEHVRAAASGAGSDAIRAAIVNPARLAPVERDSVCFQCHMLPSVHVVGPRRFGVGAYAFRPGQALTDYVLNVNAEEAGIAEADRFEINHHGWRFYQSECYRRSEGAFACTDCHDPHVKPESAAFRRDVGGVCADCHAEPATLHPASIDLAAQTCVDCHMPTRRTLDVVEVTMTDHRIARGPFDAEALVAPVAAEVRRVTDIELLDFGATPDGAEAAGVRALAALRASRGGPAALAALDRLIDSGLWSSPTPRLDALRARVRLGRFEAAVTDADALVADHPDLGAAHALRGVALLGLGRDAAAIAALERADALQPDPETRFNLALAHLRAGDAEAADAVLDGALALRPTLAGAWRYKSAISRARGDLGLAREQIERAIALDPNAVGAMQDAIDLLRETGDLAAARRWLELGRETAARLQETRN
jgi:predicted CXXCH cytochrome family protein